MNDNSNRKILPQGTWLYVAGMPANTTDEQLATFLQDCGLDISADCISIRNFGKGSSGFLSITNELVLAMVRRKVAGESIDGKAPLVVEVARRKGEVRKAA